MLCARETSSLSFSVSCGSARDSDRSTASVVGRRHLPLCRRYQALLFDVARVQVGGGGGAASRAIVWALGLTGAGQWDVLGVWPSSIAGASGWPDVFADLKVRGVERVRVFTFPECEEARQAADAAFPQAISLPSLGWLRRVSLMRAPPRGRPSVAEVVDRVCNAGSLASARDTLDAFASGPLVAHCDASMDLWRGALERLAPYYALPEQLRRHIRSGDDIVVGLHEAVGRAVAKRGAYPDTDAALSLVLEALRRAGRRQAGAIAPELPRSMGRRAGPARTVVAATMS